MQTKNDPQKLAGEVQMFRIRLATAESRLKVFREQSRQAERRREEAKRMVRRARKQFKRSKAHLSELKQALTKAEAKLFKAGGRAQARKMAKPKPIATTGARTTKKSKATARKPRTGLAAASRPPARGTRKKPAIKRTQAAGMGTGADAPDPNQSTPQASDASSKTL